MADRPPAHEPPHTGNDHNDPHDEHHTASPTRAAVNPNMPEGGAKSGQHAGAKWGCHSHHQTPPDRHAPTGPHLGNYVSGTPGNYVSVDRLSLMSYSMASTSPGTIPT